MENISLICQEFRETIDKRKALRKDLLEFIKVNINHKAVTSYIRNKIKGKKTATIHDGTLINCAGYLYSQLQRKE